MLIHPQFDPIAFSVGPLSVRWYGLMYLIAFTLFIVLGRLHARRRPELGWNAQMLDDALLYGVLGVIIGGRLGEVLFFQPGYYIEHPAQILAIWKGGMSFHGGFLGVLAAMWLYGRRHGKGFWQVTDFIAPLVPTGLAAGRVGNFINGELWGRITGSSLPWAMVFPQAGDLLPRHPSQLYHVGLEGIALFVILWFYTRSVRPRGAASGVFLIGYGAFRFITEFFREPDAGIFGQSYSISMGQWLSLPMILIGLLLLTMAYRKRA